MSELMKRLLYPYLAPKEDGDDLPGSEKTAAELAAERGDTLEDEGDEEEGAEGKGKKDAEEDDPERDEKGRFKGKDEKKDDKEDDKEEEDEVDEDPMKGKKEAEEEEEEPPKKALPATIPKARFDELNTKSQAKIRALTDEVEKLTKGAQQVVETKKVQEVEETIAKLDKDVEQLLADGKNVEAAQKMKEIRTLERDLVTARAEFLAAKSSAQAVEQMRYDTLVESLEKQYPQINPESEDYDDDQAQEIVFLKSSFEKNGMASSKALAEAVKYVFVNRVAAEDPSAKKDGEKDGEKDKKKGLRDEKGGDRKKAAIDRNEKDAKKIPSKTAGLDSDKKGGGAPEEHAADMTEEEFDALPDSTKARMRGDFV